MSDWDINTNWDESESSVQDGKSISSEKLVKDKAIKRVVKNNEVHYVKAKALTDLCN